MAKKNETLKYLGCDVPTTGDQQSIETKYENSLRLQEKVKELVNKWAPILDGLDDNKKDFEKA